MEDSLISEEEVLAKKPTDVTALMSAVPFSSVMIVVVLAVAKPDRFQDVLEIGRNYFGVNTLTLVGSLLVIIMRQFYFFYQIPTNSNFLFVFVAGGALISSVMGLLLLQQAFRGVKALVASISTWKDDGEAIKREREALVELFNATGGKCWYDNH